jgi:glucan phosphoethanolaminetransferase (alkaline phosphatase superfamily)
MSAFRWLAFVAGVVLSAVLAAIMTELVLPTLDITRGLASTQASNQGITWMQQIWNWMPLVILLLLAFGLLIAITVRKRQVVR